MMQRIFKTVEECVEKVVKDICLRNGLNEEEEMSKVRELLSMEAKVSKGKKVSSVSSVVKEDMSVLKIGRKKVQIPFNGEIREMYCRAIQKNGGLYTQCGMEKKEGRDYCAGCEKLMEEKGLESPELGRIEERMECGVMEYVGKDGEKPKAYMEILKKQKVTKEEVLEEARKRNISILEIHFEEKVENKVKVVKEKGQKGRPKKEKPVMEIEGGDDIFASLVAEANEVEEEVVVEKVEKVEKISLKAEKDAEKEAEKEAKKAEKEAEKEAKKAEKEAKLAAAKAEKEAKLAAAKAEKEAKLAAAKAEKESKLAAAKAEKEAKQAALKAEKEAKQAAAKAEKEAKKSSGSPTKKAKKEVVEDEEEEKVKKIEYEGKKYLKSLKTGVIYDYEKYKNEGDPVVVGMWIESENKIKFEDGEESEEEYDE